MNALQKGVFSLLTNNVITVGEHVVKTYDAVPEDAVLPYITLGSFTCKNLGNKTADIVDVSMQVHIWSAYEGKREVNEIADDVTAILTSLPIDLAVDGFNVMSQDVDFFEAFPEEPEGYHGVITFVAKIQNLGGQQ
jgi:hypothetical protein